MSRFYQLKTAGIRRTSLSGVLVLGGRWLMRLNRVSVLEPQPQDSIWLNWLCRDSAILPRTSASQAWGSTSLSLTVPIRVCMAADCTPPRSNSVNSQDRLPRLNSSGAGSSALIDRQMCLSARKGAKTSCHPRAQEYPVPVQTCIFLPDPTVPSGA